MRNLTRKTLDSFGAFFAHLDPVIKLQTEPATLLRDISLGSEVTVLVSQMNFLKTLVRRNGSTPEVAILATRITQGGVIRSQKWVSKIL